MATKIRTGWYKAKSPHHRDIYVIHIYPKVIKAINDKAVLINYEGDCDEWESQLTWINENYEFDESRAGLEYKRCPYLEVADARAEEIDDAYKKNHELDKQIQELNEQIREMKLLLADKVLSIVRS